LIADTMIIAATAMKKNAAGTMVFAAAAEPQACPIYYIAIYRARVISTVMTII